MKRLARLAAWLGFAAFSAFATTAMAAGPSVNILKDTDLPGFDYQINKGVTLDQCQKACTGDGLCRAFTYNTKTKWCFLKSDDPLQVSPSISVGRPRPRGHLDQACRMDNAPAATFIEVAQCLKQQVWLRLCWPESWPAAVG